MKKLVLIAVIISIFAGFAVFRFAVSLQTKTDVETKPVVEAVVNISEGTVIESDMVTVKNVPLDYAHSLSLGNLEDVVGRITKEKIEANEQVLSARLSDGSDGSDGLTYNVPTGFRAVTLATDEVIGVGGYLQDGDRVDVVATMTTEKQLSTQYVCENLEILEVGAKNSNEGYASVTLAVPENEVLELSYALTEGKYRIVLRSAVDKSVKNLGPFIP